MKLGLIMAGGLGKRMESAIPKVLHQINSKPMICYVIETAFKAGCEKVGIIVGQYRPIIEQTILSWGFDESQIVFIDQPEPLGTGNAVACACASNWVKDLPSLTNVLILSGDVPLISTDTITELMGKTNSILVNKVQNPKGYGRVQIDSQTNLVKQIIEEKDCTSEQKDIQLVNCGIYYFELDVLRQVIPRISNANAANEYYLTDLVSIGSELGYQINWYELPSNKSIEIANVNTKEDLVNIYELIKSSSK
jgi:bifunctional N-acetylglucosamine-1-phosphate-uridyltransferase/glucosamine-1-phosphate-acetyltransferase GlmU-like protein